MASGTGKRRGAVQVCAARENGWTKTARATFLTELARTCNVASACRSAGRTVGGLYRLRYRDAAFAAAWAAALEQGYDRLEAELLSRALGDVGHDTGDAAGDAADEADDAGIEAEVDAQVEAAAPAPFDAELALKLLGQRRGSGAGARERRPRVLLRQPTRLEVLVELDKRLTAMEKRLGIAPRPEGSS